MKPPCVLALQAYGGQGWTRTNEAEAVNLQSTAIAAMRPTHNGKVLPHLPRIPLVVRSRSKAPTRSV